MQVEVKKSSIPNAGRGLFALKDFQPGEIVLALDRPYVAELDVDCLADTCAWCFQSEQRSEAEPLGLSAPIQTKVCTGCKRVRYCSKSCQSKSWKREHKYECKIIAPATRPDLPHGVRAVIKLLGRLKNDPESKDEQLLDILQFQPAGRAGGTDEFKRQDGQRFEDFNTLAYGAWKYAGEPKVGGMESLGIAKGLFFNVMSNTLQLSSPLDDRKLGIGFDVILCSANHSCEPNTIAIFNQPAQLLRCLTPIKKGDELTMKYIDTTNPFSIRQAELKESYFFSCKCSKCKKGAVWAEDKLLKPPEDLSPQIAKVADNLILRHELHLPKFFVPANDAVAQRRAAAIQAEAFSVSGVTFDVDRGNASASEEEIKDALKLTLNSGLWSSTRQPVPHLLRQLLALYVSEGRIYPAWRIGLKLRFEVSPILHPEPFYPDRVIDTWLLSTLSNQLCNPSYPGSKEVYQESMKSGLDLRIVFLGFLLETRDQMERSFGRESGFGRAVENMYLKIISNTHLSVDEIREKVNETWSKLEAVAKTVDVVNM